MPRLSHSGVKLPQLTKTFDIVFDIAKKEGWPGLMRGLTPRLMKVAPACGIMVGAYEVRYASLAWRETRTDGVEQGLGRYLD